MNAVTEATPATKPAPVKAAWICLITAWVLFLLPIPGISLFVGWPVNLVAFILSIVVMTRGLTGKGMVPLIASLVVSPIIYFVGLAVMAGAAVSGDAYKDYKARADAAEATRTEQAAPAADAIKITARELFKAYDANEVAADSKFKGKPIEITGVVEAISSDITDEPVVQLSGGEMFQMVHANGLDTATAAGLSKGQEITLACTGAGEVIGTPSLSDCSLR